MSDKNDNDDGPVGYRKPPAQSRFRPGQSGNPKGRPKGSLNISTVLIRTLREKVVINENGRRKKITKFEAALKQLVNKAASGDLRALRHMLQMTAVAAQPITAQESQSTEPLNQPDQEVLIAILKRYGQVIKEAAHDEDNRD